MNNVLIRYLLIATGALSLALGTVGIFLPVLPTTPFFLLSAAVWARSSPRFHAWLLGTRFPGSYIKSYRDGLGITIVAKITTLFFLWTTILLSALVFVDFLPVRIGLILIACAVTIHIALIRTKKIDSKNSRSK